MLKKFFISVGYIIISFLSILSIENAFADNGGCHSKDSYCVNVDVGNVENAQDMDLCYILQVNASDHLTRGSVAMRQLPATVFSIAKKETSSGKPMDFKIIKAQIVAAGQCDTQPQFEEVADCEIFEYAALPGVTRTFILVKNKYKSGFTCDIDFSQ